MEEKNRMVNTRFWSDSYIQNLDPLEDRLYLYLLTNEHTHISGIYELPFYTMAAELKMRKPEEVEWLKITLEKFKNDKKIYHINGWIFVKNFLKYQKITSENQQKGVANQLNVIPPEVSAELELILGKKIKRWIQYTYSIKTQWDKRKEKKEKVKRNGKEKNGFSLLDYFKKSFVDKFGSEPAISEERDLQIIGDKIGLFKAEDEMREFITAYFDSEKGEEYGYTLSACFTDHTINLFKTGGLKNNQPSTNCDA